MPSEPANRFVTFDYAIKYILRDKVNFVILEGLLTSVLKRKVVIKEILESESNQEYDADKLNRVDLLCALEAQKMEESSPGRPRKEPFQRQPELVFIEVQVSSMFSMFHRLLFGASKLVTQYLAKGDDYEKVRKVYSITIADFLIGEGSDYAYHGRTEFVGMHDKDILRLNQHSSRLLGLINAGDIFPEYFLFRLPQGPDSTQAVSEDHLDQWLYFLKNGELPEGYTAPGLAEAKERLSYVQLSESERREYDIYQEATRDRRSVEKTKDWELRLAMEDKLAAEERTREERKLREEERKLREEERRLREEAEAKRQEAEAKREEAERNALAVAKEKSDLELRMQAMEEELRRLRGG